MLPQPSYMRSLVVGLTIVTVSSTAWVQPVTSLYSTCSTPQLELYCVYKRKFDHITVAVWSRFTERTHVRCGHGPVASLWPLRARRTVVVCGALSGQRAVEFKLSVWAHVFFSGEGRMKVVRTSDRESVVLPMGAASYLMWKAFRGSGNGVERLCAGGTERWSTSGVVTVSSLTSA